MRGPDPRPHIFHQDLFCNSYKYDKKNSKRCNKWNSQKLIKLGKHFTRVITMVYSSLCVFHIHSCSSETVETIFLFKIVFLFKTSSTMFTWNEVFFSRNTFTCNEVKFCQIITFWLRYFLFYRRRKKRSFRYTCNRCKFRNLESQQIIHFELSTHTVHLPGCLMLQEVP